MRHPFEKIIRIEIFSLIAAGVITILIIFQGFISLMVVPMLLLSLSMIAEAVIHWHMNQKEQAIKQASRSIILFVLVTYFIFNVIL